MFEFVRPAWQDHALCAGTDADLWFPELGKNAGEAKKVCFRCPVRVDCLNYALDNHEGHGIWGGATPSERRRIRQVRAQGLRGAA